MYRLNQQQQQQTSSHHLQQNNHQQQQQPVTILGGNAPAQSHHHPQLQSPHAHLQISGTTSASASAPAAISPAAIALNAMDGISVTLVNGTGAVAGSAAQSAANTLLQLDEEAMLAAVKAEPMPSDASMTGGGMSSSATTAVAASTSNNGHTFQVGIIGGGNMQASLKRPRIEG